MSFIACLEDELFRKGVSVDISSPSKKRKKERKKIKWLLHNQIQHPGSVALLHNQVQHPGSVALLHNQVQHSGSVALLHNQVQRPGSVALVFLMFILKFIACWDVIAVSKLIISFRKIGALV